MGFIDRVQICDVVSNTGRIIRSVIFQGGTTTDTTQEQQTNLLLKQKQQYNTTNKQSKYLGTATYIGTRTNKSNKKHSNSTTSTLKSKTT